MSKIKISMSKRCGYTEFFWSIFSYIRTEYGDLLCKSSCLIWVQEYKEQKNSEYGHFLRDVSPVKNIEGEFYFQVYFHRIERFHENARGLTLHKIRSFLRIRSHLLKKSLMENFIFLSGIVLIGGEPVK